MSDTTRSRQDNNTVLGDQAGRDINKIYLPAERSMMQALIERFRDEERRNQQFSDRIDELTHFMEELSEGEKKRDLAAKLTDGGRADDIPEASRLKELFYKKLQRNLLRRSAQEIIAFSLGTVWMRFRSDVAPLIARQAPKHEVDAAVVQAVVDATMRDLGENILVLLPHEIFGMVYYLTGNCFVKWD